MVAMRKLLSAPMLAIFFKFKNNVTKVLQLLLAILQLLTRFTVEIVCALAERVSAFYC